ncbi:MFS transporter [Longispora fulva]|nr:MFS transporter [Longispora fulva]
MVRGVTQTTGGPGSPAAPGDTLVAETPVPVPLGRNRSFLLLWTGSGMAVLAERFSALPFTLVVVFAGYSKTVAGFVAFAALLPMLLVQLPAGVLVDRWDRRKVMIWSSAIRLCGTVSIAVPLFFGRLFLWHLFTVAFVQGTLTIFYQLAERAAVPNVVTRDQLPTALARNEARGRAAALAGHPAGGFLFELARWAPFASSAVLYFLSLCTLLGLKGPMRADPSKVRSSPIAGAVEGLAWVWRKRYFRVALLLVAGSNLLFQGLILGVQFIVKEDGRSPATVSLILAAGGIGGMCGALLGGWWIRRQSIRYIMIITHAAWAVTMPAAALTRDPVALGGLFFLLSLIGGAVTVSGIVHQSRMTPNHLQGRVGSVVLLLVSGTSALGAISAGWLMQDYGIRPVLLGFGAVMVVLALIAVLTFAGAGADREAAEKEPDAPAKDTAPPRVDTTEKV